MVPELASEIDKIRQKAGLSMAEFLLGLREQRDHLFRQSRIPAAK